MANENQITDEAYKSSVFEDGGSLVVDLSGIQEAKFELIPPGMYDAEIDSWDFGASENSGAPMYTAVFKLLHPDYEKVKLRSYYSFSQKALPFTKAALRRFAPELVNGPVNPQKVADSGDMLGRKVRLRVTHEKDERGISESGKIARVSNVLPAAEATNGAGTGGGAKFF
jgi:hypothetical protein